MNPRPGPRPADRRRRPTPELLLLAARPLDVLDRDGFDEVLAGWLDAASRDLLQVSVVLFELRSSEAAGALAELLRNALRGVDVIGRYEPTTVAVILDADAEGSARCVDRVRSLASGAGIVLEASTITLGTRDGRA